MHIGRIHTHKKQLAVVKAVQGGLIALLLLLMSGCGDGYRHNPLRGWALGEQIVFQNPAGVEEVWKVSDYAILSFKVEQVQFVERNGQREYTGRVRFRLFDPPSRQSIVVSGAYTYTDGIRKQWELRKKEWYPLEVELHGKWGRQPFGKWLQEQTIQLQKDVLESAQWSVADHTIGDLELGRTEIIGITGDGRRRYRKAVHFSLTDRKTREMVLVTGDLHFQDGITAPWELELVRFEQKGALQAGRD